MMKMMTVMKKPPEDRLVDVLIVNTNTNSKQSKYKDEYKYKGIT